MIKGDVLLLALLPIFGKYTLVAMLRAVAAGPRHARTLDLAVSAPLTSEMAGDSMRASSLAGLWGTFR